MKLYFLRHGDAVAHPSYHDSERPLSDHGHEQARVAGSFLKATHCSIDLIVCSPLLRARQTAENVQSSYGEIPIQTSEYLVASSNQMQLFDLLSQHQTETVLLVGHEPHLSATISLLISGGEHARVEMKKASLACVEVAKPVGKGGSTLQWLQTIDHMRGVIQ